MPAYPHQAVVLLLRQQQPPRHRVLKVATEIMFGTIQIYWPLITRRVAGRVLKHGASLTIQIRDNLRGGPLARIQQLVQLQQVAGRAATINTSTIETPRNWVAEQYAGSRKQYRFPVPKEVGEVQSTAGQVLRQST